MNNIKKRLLQLTLILSMFPIITGSSKSEKKEEIKNTISYEILDSIDDLKLHFDEEITFDIVRKSLNNNSNINDEYRSYTNEFINLVEIHFPNIDLTIFNENIKLFSNKEISKEEMQKDKDREAYYDTRTITIYMHDEHENDNIKKYCYFHELWHMFNSLYLEIEDVIYYKSPTMFGYDATAFNEGMTTLLTEKIFTSSVVSYTRQYDQIKILYNIYGEELIEIYLNSGVEGIEMFLGKQIGYSKASNLIKFMNDELDNPNMDVTSTFEILLELYFEHKKSDVTDYEVMFATLENLSYEPERKVKILSLFHDWIEPIVLDENALVTFDSENYYNINDLYFVECNDNIYLINNDILVEYLYKGIIGNIYDEEKKYIGLNPVKSQKSFIDYLKYHSEIFIYDELNNIIYVDSNLVKGDSYVKSKQR